MKFIPRSFGARSRISPRRHCVQRSPRIFPSRSRVSVVNFLLSTIYQERRVSLCVEETEPRVFRVKQPGNKRGSGKLSNFVNQHREQHRWSSDPARIGEAKICCERVRNTVLKLIARIKAAQKGSQEIRFRSVCVPLDSSLNELATLPEEKKKFSVQWMFGKYSNPALKAILIAARA